jgi:GT2 family glycosyltransferase
LYRVADLLDADPRADLIYSDEDEIDGAECRLDPLFKPDWNPALILSHNYFGHLGFFRRSLVNEVGGFGVGFDGAEGYELLLRCLERTTPERIRHIPAILYHRRGDDAGKRLGDGEEKVWEAGRRAIAQHLNRLGIAGEVRCSLEGCYQVHYRMPNEDAPRVSIVIPTTGQLALIKNCVLSLDRLTTYRNYDINVTISAKHFAVGERKEFLESLQKQLALRVFVHDVEPFSYAEVNNRVAAQVSGTIICFMNDDIEVITPDWLDVMLARLLQEGVGAVGPKLYYPNDTIQHAGVILGSAGVADHPFRFLPRDQPGYAGRAVLEQDVSCVTGACLLIQREIFEGLNGFAQALEIAYNDVDLCLRLRKAGWRIVWTPCAEFYHHESVSVGRPDDPAREEKFAHEIRLMRQLWGSVLDNDPFYNPNLSLEPGRLFHLADPPRSARSTPQSQAGADKPRS